MSDVAAKANIQYMTHFITSTKNNIKRDGKSFIVIWGGGVGAKIFIQIHMANGLEAYMTSMQPVENGELSHPATVIASCSNLH
jgi:hypothetical protein